MESTPRRRTRSTGPSRSGVGARAGRGTSAARTVRTAGVPGELADQAPDTQDRTDVAGFDQDRPKDQPARMAGTRTAGGRSGRTGSSRTAGTRPGTAPSAAASVGGRRIGRLIERAVPKVAGTSRVTSQLIKQVAILGLVFCAVALALAVPLRNYLAQRTDLGAEMSAQQQREMTLAALTREQLALADPAFIAAEAKRRLQYVKPGDTVYVVHAPALPATAAAATPPVSAAAPWYSHLWDTLSDPTQTAAPGAPPSPESAVPGRAPGTDKTPPAAVAPSKVVPSKAATGLATPSGAGR